MPLTWTGRDSVARAIARTSHALVETPSRAAAFSTAPLSDSGRRRLIRADSSSPTGAGALAGGVDEDELGLLPGEPHLDVAGGQLRVELERGLREQVEQLQPQIRAERLAEAPGDLRRPLVAELGEAVQVFLEPFEDDGQIHDDITMTSLIGVCQASSGSQTHPCP